MYCLELEEFYRRFGDRLEEIDVKDAQLVRTIEGDDFLVFSANIERSIDKENILIIENNSEICSHGNRNIIESIEIDLNYLHQWNYDKDATINANQFLIEIKTENKFSFIKPLLGTLKLEEFNNIKLLKHENFISYFIFEFNSYQDLHIITNLFTKTTHFKVYYYNIIHRNYLPINLVSISEKQGHVNNIYNFPNNYIYLNSCSRNIIDISKNINLNKNYLQSRKISNKYIIKNIISNVFNNFLCKCIYISRFQNKLNALNSLKNIFIENKLVDDTKFVIYFNNNNFYILFFNIKLIRKEFLLNYIYSINEGIINFQNNYCMKYNSEILDRLIKDINNKILLMVVEYKKKQTSISEYNILSFCDTDLERISESINYCKFQNVKNLYNSNFAVTTKSYLFIINDFLTKYNFISDNKSYIGNVSIKSNIINKNIYNKNILDDNKEKTIYKNDSNHDFYEDNVLLQTEYIAQDYNSDLIKLENILKLFVYRENKQIQKHYKIWKYYYNLVTKNIIFNKILRIEYYYKFLEALINCLWLNIDKMRESLFDKNSKKQYLAIISKFKSFSIETSIITKILSELLNMQNASTINSLYFLYIEYSNSMPFKLRIIILEILIKQKNEKIFIHREIENIINLLNIKNYNENNNFSMEYLNKSLTPISNISTHLNPSSMQIIINYIIKLSSSTKYFKNSTKQNHVFYLQILQFYIIDKNFINNSMILKHFDKYLLNNNSLTDVLHEIFICVHNKSNILAKLLIKLYSKIQNSCKNTFEFTISNLISNISINLLLQREIDKDLFSEFINYGIDTIHIFVRNYDSWIKILGRDNYNNISLTVISSFVETYNNNYIEDRYLISIIHTLDCICKNAANNNSDNYIYNQLIDNPGSFANNLINRIAMKYTIKESQYKILLNVKYLNLSKLYINIIFNNEIFRLSVYSRGKSNSTLIFMNQALYAKYLCYQEKNNESYDLLLHIITSIEVLINSKTSSIVTKYPLHKLIIDLLELFSLTGKFTEINNFIHRIEKIIKFNDKYFGISILSSERTDIYIAIIDCYASLSSATNAEKSILNLLDNLLPCYKNSYIEHLFYFFQNLWKTINKSFPHLTKNIIKIFGKIFEYYFAKNKQDFLTYCTHFKIYKDFSDYVINSNCELPSISILDSNNKIVSQNAQPDILALKLWFEVAGEINVLKYVDIIEFIRHSELQIKITNSGLQGFIELTEFIINQINREKTIINEDIIKHEISEIKKRLFNLYSH